MTYCTKCGTQVAEGVKFCTSCGNPMGTAQPQPQQQAAQPQQPQQQAAPQQPQQTYQQAPQPPYSNRISNRHTDNLTNSRSIRRNRSRRVVIC